MQTEYQSLQFKAQETLADLMEQLPVLEDKRAESAALLIELDRKVAEAMKSKETSEELKKEIEASYNEKAAALEKAEAEIEAKIKKAQEEAARKAREEAERKRKEEEERKKQEAANKTPTTQQQTPTQNKTPVITGKYVWPTESAYTKVSSQFGWRTSPLSGKPEFHNGIDIPAAYGSAIYAADGGTVIISERHYSYGNYVVIDHGNGLTTLYAHNTKNLVKVGDVVDKGQ